MSCTPPVSRARACCAALRRFTRSTDAGPIVEFALVAPILMMIVLAIADFSLAFLARNNLVSAVREGARLGAVQASDPCNVANTATITAIKDRVKLYLTPSGATFPTTAQVNVTCPVAGYIQVEIVNYPYTPATPILSNPIFNVNVARECKSGKAICLSAAAVYRWERS